MCSKLLTETIISLVNKKAQSGKYGVTISNIPHFDYSEILQRTKSAKHNAIEFYFLGYYDIELQELKKDLPQSDGKPVFFTVEEAEESRNTGREDIFRVLIIKRREIEKLSSLMWLDDINLSLVYRESCRLAKEKLTKSNLMVNSMISALARQDVRELLNFERVLDYLEDLLNCPSENLPFIIRASYYKLGLCKDSEIDEGDQSIDSLRSRIKSNRAIVDRIGEMEKTERQSLNNYNTKNPDSIVARLILKYYTEKELSILGDLELKEVEACLKAVGKAQPPRNKNGKKIHISATTAGTELAFNGDLEKVTELLDEIKDKMKQRDREKNKKPAPVEVEVNGSTLIISPNITTEKIAAELTSDYLFGGVIYADEDNPKTAIDSINKYEFDAFDKGFIDSIFDKLYKIREVNKNEKIIIALKEFMNQRAKIARSAEAEAEDEQQNTASASVRMRLQDSPMLQVLNDKAQFSAYLNSYARLLTAIVEEFSSMWRDAPAGAKEIVGKIISLDMVYVIGKACHAIPTSTNPLYLWKYIKLAEEIQDANGVGTTEIPYLSENDKAFILRKADEIPDPLTVSLLPAIFGNNATYLPLTGRLGCLPIYSTKPQINQSESGMDSLKKAIIRYLCLYPHAGMMLHLCIVNPPSVESVVEMLKKLNSDKEFNVMGVDLTVLRTRDISDEWVEISDNSSNTGMLGSVRACTDMQLRLAVVNSTLSYQEVISRLKLHQHLLVVFDPNEINLDLASNNRQIHLHPLCIPKVYEYDVTEDEIKIRATNEGSMFSEYSSILEKLNEHPSSFRHTSSYFNTPLKQDTYEKLLLKADWLIMLDYNLKCWDISLRSASEKIYYREDESRSIGIYSNNCKKFIKGYTELASGLGNFIPKETGIQAIIQAIRSINDDGLLSIVSHTSNKIFDYNHGKGSLGLALSVLSYKQKHPDALLVGLDTQLAREWLSERKDGVLPDLIGIRDLDAYNATIDIIEVKTYDDYSISGNTIGGHAVDQVAILEDLVREIFGQDEKVTTISRKEILREQIFEALFETNLNPKEKHRYTHLLNGLFAGEYDLIIEKSIYRISFDSPTSFEMKYNTQQSESKEEISLVKIGSGRIQEIMSGLTVANINLCDTPPKEEASNEKMYVNITETDLQNGQTRTTEACTSSTIGDSTATIQEEKFAVSQTDEKYRCDLTQENELKDEIIEKCFKLNKVFKNLNISVQPINEKLVQQAARFIRFKLEISPGEYKKLEKHKMDIAIELEAYGEILIDHIKGTRYVSMDVPFEGLGAPLRLVECLDFLRGDGELNIIAGQAPDGQIQVIDIAKAPHMLIAGTTGSGKTVFLFSLILSLLHTHKDDELEMILIDPKQTDFVFFNDLSHLRGKKVITNAEDALEALKRINEFDKELRTKQLVESKSKDIYSYNLKNPLNKMKRIVVVIDEYADLVQAAELQGIRKEFESMLCMLAQRVRNLGIHLVIATQRPNAAIVTSSLKANIPFRISFRLPAHQDSQTILDRSGAEDLLGKGDMLMLTESDVLRLQGCYITEDETEAFLRKIGQTNKES